MKNILIALFSVCIFPVGCLWIPLLNGGKFMHTTNEPTRTNNPLDFQGGGIEAYNKMVVPRLGSSGVRALFAADDHLSTTLVQRWINDIDAMLRKKNPEKFADIPPPIARVWLNAAPNGFAIPISVCAKVLIQFSDAANILDSQSAVSITFKGLLFSMKRDKCRDAGTVSPHQIAEWFNRNIDSCKHSVSATDAQVLATGCNIAPALSSENIGKAEGYGFFSTSQVITITSGMILKLKQENQLVAVIAHELGHYYRSHPSMYTNKYNFFFKLGAENSSSKPVPDAALSELGAQAVAASKKSRMPGGKFNVTDPDAQKVLLQAISSRLGQYTYEQEADELALEWLAELGIEPQVLTDKLFALLQFKSDKVTNLPFEFGYEHCKKLSEYQWKLQDGSMAFVPVGDFSNPHHSLCYRAFNTSREIQAHKYSRKQINPVFLDEESLKKLKDSLVKLHKDNGIADTGHDVPDDSVQ